MFINFCVRQHPDFGGTYTAQSLFRRVLNSYLIDLKILEYDLPSEADFTISNSTNPVLASARSSFPRFFSFIPEEIKQSTKGVIAHGAFLAHFSYAYQLSRHLNVPLYIVPHGTTDPYVFSYGKFKKRIWLELIGRPAAYSAKRIIFSTKAEQDKSILPFAQLKGCICPFAVEPPDDIDRIACRRFIRQKFGLGDEDKILLYFSKLDNFKRPLETIKSFINVNPKGWKLLVVGYYQPKDEPLKKQIETLSEHPNVFTYPPVFGEQKWKFLAGSDLFVLFSHRENFGFSVAEAASVGTPIYISKGVDIHPFFESEYGRLVFDINNQSDIEEALSNLTKITFEDLKHLGKICQNIIFKNFTFEKFSKTIKHILED
jgi:glycosyltransferase involved in cell wall biosynthesis